jgi:hypothetical protein
MSGIIFIIGDVSLTDPFRLLWPSSDFADSDFYGLAFMVWLLSPSGAPSGFYVEF